MGEAESGRRLTGWQRAHVYLAAEYMRELTVKRPDEEKARAVYEALLDVLEPARRAARHRRGDVSSAASGSMWERRSARERRVITRRTQSAPPAPGGERRRAHRRSGRDRRAPKG
jgi:hypothetical protein